MEKIELVEKLVSTFGVSYAKAKEAFEACGWDAVDAAVYLEKEKQAEEKSEEKCCEEHKKGAKGSFNIPVDEMKESGNSCFKTCWDFFSKNTVVVKKSTGELFLEIPIWLAVILLCAFFWAIFFVVGILFVMGYRFSFNGPQLGNNRVKNTMNQVGNAAKDFAHNVKNAVSQDECGTAEEQPEIVVEKPAEEEKKEEKSSEE